MGRKISQRWNYEISFMTDDRKKKKADRETEREREERKG